MVRRAHYRLTLGIAGVVYALDQLTKAWVVQRLAPGESWAPWPDWAFIFQITHTTNTGIAFGLFPDRGLLFVLIALATIALGVVFYRRMPTPHWMVKVALGLQLGGALGNLTDRLTRGAVIDFVDMGPFWIFNVADSSVVVGTIVLGLYFLWEERIAAAPPVLVSHVDGE